MTENVHAGHRKRMLDKFLEFGSDVFATYELLEMLLYAVVKYKDTNPLSKSILKNIGGICEISSTSVEEMMQIKNVGENIAGLLSAVGKFNRAILDASELSSSGIDASDYTKIGEIFAEYFGGEEEHAVALMCIDNKNRVIAIETLYNLDFQSGAVRPQSFIDCALRHKASSVAIAHTHKHSLTMATEGDRATNRLVVECLEAVNISVVEHFIICGKRYTGFMKTPNLVMLSSGQGTRAQTIKSQRECADSFCRALGPLVSLDVERVLSAISLSSGLERLLAKSPADLSCALSVSVKEAVYIKIMLALCMRGVTDNFKGGGRYADEQIAEYLKARFYARENEFVCLLSFDGKGRFIASDNLGGGTVNYSGIVPRMTMEKAILRGAKSIYIAHNHPGGYASPSIEDINAIESLYKLYSATNISFDKSVIVSGRRAAFVSCENLSVIML